MDSYLFQLLKLFVENGPMTPQEIAFYGNITKRTVASRIKELNELLGDAAHISKRIIRYQLTINDYSAFLHLETQFLKGELDLNDPIKRKAFIIDCLIKHPDFIALDEIADQMTISRKVVNKDVKSLREELKEYDAEIQSVTGKGIRLISKYDYDILFIIRNFVVEHVSKDSWTGIIKKFEDSTDNLNLTSEVKKQILSNLITVQIAKEYHIEVKNFPKRFLILWKNDEIVQTLKQSFSDIVGTINSAEEEFLLSPLTLYKNDSLDDKKLKIAFDQNYQLLLKVIEDDLFKYGINLQKIYIQLKWHLLFVVNRALLHKKITEVLPHNIPEQYPISFELSLKLAKVLENHYQVHLSNDEINYFIIYFQMFLDERIENPHNQVRIAFVGEIRTSVKQFIESKLLQVFDQLQTSTFNNITDYKQSNNKYLLVFSDKPFNYGDTQVINIGTAFRAEALSVIMQVSMAEHLIEEKKCKLTVDKIKATDYFDAVEQLIDKQIKLGELSSDFKDNWIKREKETNNIFANGIAIPHAVDSSGKKRILISVGIISNKINFRNRNVKLVFLIGIPKSLDNELVNATSRIYDLLGLISRNNILYENFLNYDNSKTLMQITEGV